MVVFFFVQTLGGDPDFVPEICYIEPVNFLTSKFVGDVAATSQKEKDCLNYLLKRIQAEYLFRKQVASSHNIQRPSANDHGIFRVNDSQFFSDEFYVIWQSSFGCGYVMVTKTEENKALAENILSIIVNYTCTVFDVPEQNSKQQLLENPDKMACIMNVFLPSGQLLSLNHRSLKLCQKDLEKLLAEKS